MQADMLRLPFPDNTFDLVHTSHVLEHMREPLSALSELRRVTRCWVIIKIPNAVYYRTSYEDPSHMYSWNESTFKNLIRTHFDKFQIINSMGIERYEGHSKLRTVKRLLLTAILKNRELIAVCEKTDVAIRQVSSFPDRLTNEPEIIQ